MGLIPGGPGTQSVPNYFERDDLKPQTLEMTPENRQGAYMDEVRRRAAAPRRLKAGGKVTVKESAMAGPAKKSTKVKKYADGGRVAGDDVPEERGPSGIRYNRLLRERRANREREKEFEPDLRSEQILLGAKRAARGPDAGGSERLAREAAADAARRRDRTAFYQGNARRLERMLDDEGARIGQRRDATRVEDNGYKKGGLVRMDGCAVRGKTKGKMT
jgi:hypothetical protein